MRFRKICSGFGCSNIHTDEDYLRILRRRQRFFIGMLILGIVTFAIAVLAEFTEWDVSLSSHMLNYYSGVGTGLISGALVFLWSNRQTMKDPEKLRKSRITATDERMQEINRRALAVAGYALLIAVYLVCLIGGPFYPELLTVLAGLAFVFIATYLIGTFIYNKLM